MRLIDLPGLFRWPDNGMCYNDLDIQIARSSHLYISNPSAIIITVVAANFDTNGLSEVFSLATRADPVGSHTVGVLTKVDLVEGNQSRLQYGRSIVNN